MKNTLFLTSHLYSGSSALFHMLQENMQIAGKRTGICYDHYNSLYKLWSISHRFDSPHNIYMDELLFNHEFAHKLFYNACDFIYIIREPKASIGSMIKNKNYSLINAVNYYTFRLKRIQKMAYQSKNYMFLTYSDLVDGKYLDKLNDFLMLKNPLKSLANVEFYKFDDTIESVIPFDKFKELEELYENTVYKLINFNNRSLV
jgi:hypothetical protein